MSTENKSNVPSAEAATEMHEPTISIPLPGPIPISIKIPLPATSNDNHPDVVGLFREAVDKRKDEQSPEDQPSDSQTEIKKRFRNEILEKYIFPDDEDTIQKSLTNKKYYAFVLQVVWVIKIISTLIAPVLIFTNSQFPGHYLDYVAGVCGFSVAIFEATEHAITQANKKRVDQINEILASVGVMYRMPDTLSDQKKDV